MLIQVFTDGGSRGNPGEAAIGVVIKLKTQMSNVKTKEEIIKFGKRIGLTTNNEAEYAAVIEALRQIKNEKLKKIQIQFFLDSSLVCNQLRGLFKVKEARLRELLLRIRELEGELGVYPIYTLIPREQNKEADKLVNEALDKG